MKKVIYSTIAILMMAGAVAFAGTNNKTVKAKDGCTCTVCTCAHSGGCTCAK